jgi:hypothetical protein
MPRLSAAIGSAKHGVSIRGWQHAGQMAEMTKATAGMFALEIFSR